MSAPDLLSVLVESTDAAVAHVARKAQSYAQDAARATFAATSDVDHGRLPSGWANLAAQYVHIARVLGETARELEGLPDAADEVRT